MQIVSMNNRISFSIPAKLFWLGVCFFSLGAGVLSGLVFIVCFEVGLVLSANEQNKARLDELNKLQLKSEQQLTELLSYYGFNKLAKTGKANNHVRDNN